MQQKQQLKWCSFMSPVPIWLMDGWKTKLRRKLGREKPVTTQNFVMFCSCWFRPGQTGLQFSLPVFTCPINFYLLLQLKYFLKTAHVSQLTSFSRADYDCRNPVWLANLIQLSLVLQTTNFYYINPVQTSLCWFKLLQTGSQSDCLIYWCF